MRRTAGLAAFAIALSGCGEVGGSTPVAEVRDSAGVRLVDNRGAVWAPETAWKVGEPTLSVGGLDVPEEEQLYDVTAAALLSDGRIVVADNGSKELRFFDSSGRLLGVAGRKGGGPGEFGHILDLVRIRGDSLLIWDAGNGRAAVHDPEGRFVRTFKLESSEAGLARFPGPTLVAFPDGSVLGLEWMGESVMGAPQGLFRSTASHFLFDSEGREVGSVGAFPWMEMFVGTEQVEMMNGQSMNRRGMLRFGKATSLAAGDSTFWVHDGGGTLDRYDREGRHVQRIRRIDVPRIAVTPELAARDLELYMAEEETHGHPDAQLESMRRFREEMPLADTVPTYRALRVDERHHLWAERHAGVEDPSAPTAWDVFEPSGRFLGSVLLPPRFKLMDIGATRVLGVTRDELDIEYLTLLPLLEPS